MAASCKQKSKLPVRGPLRIAEERIAEGLASPPQPCSPRKTDVPRRARLEKERVADTVWRSNGKFAI